MMGQLGDSTPQMFFKTDKPLDLKGTFSLRSDVPDNYNNDQAILLYLYVTHLTTKGYPGYIRPFKYFIQYCCRPKIYKNKIIHLISDLQQIAADINAYATSMQFENNNLTLLRFEDVEWNTRVDISKLNRFSMFIILFHIENGSKIDPEQITAVCGETPFHKSRSWRCPFFNYNFSFFEFRSS